MEAALLVLRGTTLPTAALICAVVGTLISGINEGASLAAHGLTLTVAIKISTNYAVPFVVSSIGYLAPFRTRGAIDGAGPPA